MSQFGRLTGVKHLRVRRLKAFSYAVSLKALGIIILRSSRFIYDQKVVFAALREGGVPIIAVYIDFLRFIFKIKSQKIRNFDFDVIPTIGGNEGNASNYAQDFIKELKSTDSIKLDSCKFCHTEKAKTNVSEKVEKDGYCIVPIGNFPNPDQ